MRCRDDLYVAWIHIADAVSKRLHDGLFGGPLPRQAFGLSVGVTLFASRPRSVEERAASRDEQLAERFDLHQVDADAPRLFRRFDAGLPGGSQRADR